MKQFPFKEQIQRGILYLYKNSEDFHLEIDPLVHYSYFEFPIHQKLFKCIRDYRSNYSKLPTDSILQQSINDIKDEDELRSDYEEEIDLINNVAVDSLDNKPYYLDLIEKWAKEQRMISAIKQSMIYLKEGKLDKIREEIEEASKLNRNVNTGTDFYETAESRWQDDYRDCPRVRSIFSTVDKSIDGGLEPGELAMVVAPPGVGKSLALANIAVCNLIDGKKVLYLSGEMSEKKTAMRIDSICTLMGKEEIKLDPLKFSKRLKIFRDSFPTSELIIKDFYSGQTNCNNIRAILNQLRNRKDFIPDLVIVDYLELLKPVTEQKAEYQNQQIVARELRSLGKEFNVPIWTATQTNREGAKVKVITDTELGDSYGKIREADIGISLNQTLEEYESGSMRYYVLKAREAKARYSVQLSVNYNFLKMKEVKYEEENSVEA